jgi:Zn-dependent protease/CBS domain-containing protein
MRWSLRIATVAGIGIYVHITFLLIFILVVPEFFRGGPVVALSWTAFLLSCFTCVVFHELGHALTAKRFGVRTKDIVLLPIGGVARLERIPREPRQEFVIAIAGPLVNVAIALVLAALLFAGGFFSSASGDDLARQVSAPTRIELEIFGARLLLWNVTMFLFNLIPAFPMDGGRILRSLLAMRLDYTRATRVAAAIGQLFAVVFAVIGVFYSPFLVLIAVFVFLGAAGEAAAAQVYTSFQGLPTSTGMMTEFKRLGNEDTLGTAVAYLLAGNQIDFPVIADEKVAGVLTRQQLVAALREHGPDRRVADLDLKAIAPVQAGDPLYRTYEEMARQGVNSLPVLDGEALAGWITRDNMAEVAMVREALGGDARIEKRVLGTGG